MTQKRNKAETKNSSIKSKDLLYVWDKYLFIIILQHYKFLELKNILFLSIILFSLRTICFYTFRYIFWLNTFVIIKYTYVSVS